MNRILVITVLIGIGLLGVGCSPKTTPPSTAPSVDLPRYMGKWYEIASIANRFQRGCRCTTARYQLNDLTVSVVNQCMKGNNKTMTQARAKAWIANRDDNSKLNVQFFWPFRANYWILAISPNYQYALVGTPNRRYLWILSRTPTMPKVAYQQLVNTAQQKGYAVQSLKKTLQNCNMHTQSSLTNP